LCKTPIICWTPTTIELAKIIETFFQANIDTNRG
jgi:hypothetical protein